MPTTDEITQRLKDLKVSAASAKADQLWPLLHEGEPIKGYWVAKGTAQLVATPERLLVIKGVFKNSYTSIPWGAIASADSTKSLLQTRLTLSLKNGEVIKFEGQPRLAQPSIDLFTEQIPKIVASGRFKGGEIENGDDVKKLAADKRRLEADLADLHRQLSVLDECLDVARHFEGEDASELLLKPGERVFYYAQGSGLIEERRSGASYSGRSAGVSIPIGHIGRYPVRYRIGASKGHITQSAPHDVAIDTGTTFITNQRVAFVGMKQTREIVFTKLVGYHHDTDDGRTTFSVSNRQKPITLYYGKDILPAFVFRLELALSHYKNTTPEMIKQLEQSRQEIEAQLRSQSVGTDQAA